MEKDFINLIKTTLNSPYIGDDCAYLKDLDILVSQDSLVEGVHFLRDKITPRQLGWKSAMVNISDICAGGGEPKYMTISLSLPKDINSEFIKEFYEGAGAACEAAGKVQIAGGDITASPDKIFISAAIIGSAKGRNISSRANARTGQRIIAAGVHGSSAAGLKLLLSGKKAPEKFIKAHLEPFAQVDFSRQIACSQKGKYAMMDTSDGLMDALSQIAQASNVLMSIDFDKIPVDEEIKSFPNWHELVLFGGEDYGLIATTDTPPAGAAVIGCVKEGSGVEINGNFYPRNLIEQKIFKHF